MAAKLKGMMVKSGSLCVVEKPCPTGCGWRRWRGCLVAPISGFSPFNTSLKDFLHCQLRPGAASAGVGALYETFRRCLFW